MANRRPVRQKIKPLEKSGVPDAPQEDVEIVGGAVLDARIFIGIESVSPGAGAELLNMAEKGGF